MRLWLVIVLIGLFGCSESTVTPEYNNPYVLVLGVAQDAGYPQIGCDKECCKEAWNHNEKRKFATSLAVVDPSSNEWWLFECTPDIKDQLDLVKYHFAAETTPLPTGILLTHAHMGHYTGLMHFGREAMGSTALPVYTMPRMADYLNDNGPWSQLVNLKNISLKPLAADSMIQLNNRISITPILVPHRDEYSETVGFRIMGPTNTVLFLPDIDKWNKWEKDINAVLTDVDLALIDGTFYQNGEIPGRDMSEIPHPFIEETIQLITDGALQRKVRFIHFNHTNPVIKPDSEERKALLDAGFGVANQLDTYAL